jgi:hypothetical protein
MYTNIPKHNTTNIISNILKSNTQINENIKKGTLHITQKILEQNYFRFKQQYHKEIDRLAMGAPTSAIQAKTYIQHMEHTLIQTIL